MSQKQSFIETILKSKQMNTSQKERFLVLASHEFEKVEDLQKDLAKQLEDVKTKLEGLDGKIIVDKEVKVTVKDKPKRDLIHNPIETSKFLQALSSDSNPLKYLIHDKTDGFDYNEMQEKWLDILTNYRTLFSKNIKYNVIKRMKEFIGCDPQNWFFKGKVEKFKLSNDEVINWCKKNPGKHPIMHFDNEISYFKESIKIKKGSLQNMIEEILLERFGNDYYKLKLDFINIDKAEFYTDVDALIAGLKNIFNSLNQRIDHGQTIKFSFEAKALTNGRLRILKIIHVDSECDKALTKEEIFGPDNGGDFKEAEQRFLQNCDWSIVAKNPDKNYNKLNILYDFTNKNIEPREKVNPLEIEGFTHILTFYS
jgi:hypothetical protein